MGLFLSMESGGDVKVYGPGAPVSPGLSQSTLGVGFGPEPEYSGREFWARARALWESVFGPNQSTLGGGFGPQPEYSGRMFWA